MHDGLLTVCLGGDVMLGRGIDQILPNPGDPTLQEPQLRDARAYVSLAEAVNGPIPRPVDFSWPWLDALEVLETVQPDVRVVNLETSITRSSEFAPEKGVHYRMNPANLPCLLAARPDVSVLANNHVLDFGDPGLDETLDTLAAAGLPAAGAGRDRVKAWQPAAVTVDGGRRVLVFSVGLASSGIPPEWAATEDRGGVNFLPELSDATAAEITDRVRQTKQPGDVVVASVHWGSNWGYEISRDQILFAHRLIDDGVDLVHGHSSHHPRPVEVYHNRLILYGCGDLVDDYEGIAGYQEFRDDLRLLYFASCEPDTGKLVSMRMAPLQARKMRLRHASRADTEWLRAVLDRISRDFGPRIRIARGNARPASVMPGRLLRTAASPLAHSTRGCSTTRRTRLTGVQLGAHGRRPPGSRPRIRSVTSQAPPRSQLTSTLRKGRGDFAAVISHRDGAMTDTADRTEWARLLDRMSREHDGQLITIEVLDPAYGDQYEAERLPFTGATFDRKDDAVIVAVGGGSPRYPVVLRHIITHPTDVTATESMTGAAFRVVDADGIATLVRFFPAIPS